jgi:hypothetical protein
MIDMDQNKPFDDQKKQGGQNPNDPNRHPQGGEQNPQHQGGSQHPGQGGQHPQGGERQGGEKQGGQNR